MEGGEPGGGLEEHRWVVVGIWLAAPSRGHRTMTII